MQEEEIPDWVENTLDEHSYVLSLYESNDASVEGIEMDREEYIALKAHLAALQGYTGCDPAAAVAELKGKELKPGVFISNTQQAAEILLTARAVYRLCPDAVVSRCPEPEPEPVVIVDTFDVGLRSLAEKATGKVARATEPASTASNG